MKVKRHVSFCHEEEVEINVSIDDVIEIFSEVPKDLQINEAMGMVSQIPKLFNSIPDEVLRGMNDYQCDTILKYLKNAISRIETVRK